MNQSSPSTMITKKAVIIKAKRKTVFVREKKKQSAKVYNGPNYQLRKWVNLIKK